MGGMPLPAGAAPPPETPGVGALAPGTPGFAPGIAGLAPAAPGAPATAGRGGTWFAGRPLAVGGPDAPTLGALGGVTFGLFAPTPGPAADACGFGRCGLGCPDPAPGVGGVTRDIKASIQSASRRVSCASRSNDT